MIPIAAQRIEIGGLMRCCTETLREWLAGAGPSTAVGTIVKCRYCKEQMKLAEDGHWKWDHD